VLPREEGRCFFRNSFSIRSLRFSSSSAFTHARSTGEIAWSGSGCSRRQAFTQCPSVPSWIPRSRATSAIGLPVSITICTASALNCGLNWRRCSGIDRSSQSPRESLSKIFNTPQKSLRGWDQLSSLNIACTRRAEEIASLKARKDWAEKHLGDTMFGAFDDNSVAMIQAQRHAKVESIEAMSRQIADLQALGDDSVVERYYPDIPPAIKARLAGINFADSPEARGSPSAPGSLGAS
jgi:hypothetical protein